MGIIQSIGNFYGGRLPFSKAMITGLVLGHGVGYGVVRPIMNANDRQLAGEYADPKAAAEYLITQDTDGNLRLTEEEVLVGLVGRYGPSSLNDKLPNMSLNDVKRERAIGCIGSKVADGFASDYFSALNRLEARLKIKPSFETDTTRIRIVPEGK